MSGPGAELGLSFAIFALMPVGYMNVVERGTLPWNDCSGTGREVRSSFVKTDVKNIFKSSVAYVNGSERNFSVIIRLLPSLQANTS